MKCLGYVISALGLIRVLSHQSTTTLYVKVDIPVFARSGKNAKPNTRYLEQNSGANIIKYQVTRCF